MNSLSAICITWDMDKIIYTCNAEHIGFIFPKRKWWDVSKKPREARLEAVEIFSGKKVRILMRILENDCILAGMSGAEKPFDKEALVCKSETLPYHIYVPAAYREEIRREFIRQSCRKRQFEVLLVVDVDGTDLADVLMEAAEDVNYLAVFTNAPEQYEIVLERIAQETGLVGMIFTQQHDFKQYQRRVCEEKSVLVFMGNQSGEDCDRQKRVFLHFPQNSLILDFNEQEYGPRTVWTKRMENDYVSIAIFLDNIIKNGYNSLVNEGLQTEDIQIFGLQQNVYRTDDKNKLSEKRKGIKKWKKRRIF